MTNSESPLKPKQVKEIYTISGVNLSFTNSEERYVERDDLILISFKNKSNFAGVFTKSTAASEAVKWCQKIIKNNDIRAIIVNAGNANVFTGELGKSAINKIISKLSSCLKIFKNQILIAQTGVIGEPLKTHKIVGAISNLTDKFMRDPVKILVKTEQLTLEGINQYYVALNDDNEKYDALKDIYGTISVSQCIIYCNSITRVQKLYENT